MIADLESKRAVLENLLSLIRTILAFLHHLFPKNPFSFVRWILQGGICMVNERKPLHAIWGGDTSKKPICDYTIGIDSIEKMVEK